MRSSTGSGSTEYQFTGQQQDATLGYTYLRARYYDPSIGRFISKDTHPALSKLPQTINRYTYTDNNPVNLTDPTGECPWCAIAAVAAFTGLTLEDLLLATAGAAALAAALNSNESNYDDAAQALEGMFNSVQQKAAEVADQVFAAGRESRAIEEIARQTGEHPNEVGKRLEDIKHDAGRGGKDNVKIDTRTGDITDPKTGEVLGNLKDK